MSELTAEQAKAKAMVLAERDEAIRRWNIRAKAEAKR